MTGNGSGSLQANRPHGLVPAPDDELLRSTVDALVEVGGTSVAAILLYGSRVQNSSPDRWSAYDFLLITDSYSRFFKSLGPKAHRQRPPWLLTAVSHILPPNVISFGMGSNGLPVAKCAVVTPRHFREALGPRSRDHFLKGRVVQKLALLWSRSPAEEERVISALREAREGIVRWVRPFLAGDFSLELFSETMLRVSYRGETRPESSDRVRQVVLAQKDTLMGIAGEALAAAVERGEVVCDSGSYRWRRPPGKAIRAVYDLYFAVSKARATARWLKYMITFDGWMDYIIKKIQRRAGFEVEVVERERRWPVLFLWPKLFRVLGALREAGPPSSSGNEEELE